MVCQLKKMKLSSALVALLFGATTVGASQPTPKGVPTYPIRTDGIALGFGAGVKLLNLKNITTQTSAAGVATRSADAFANTSSPVVSVYVRKYMHNTLCISTFLGFEFNYLTRMRKTSIYTNLNLPNGVLDTGYRYRERWDARAMLGALLWSGSQLDLWAQAGLQLTNFDYEGRVTEAPGGPTQVFKMDNNYALAPAGGLEVRFSHPLTDSVATDFILGWTAGYRNAFNVIGTSTANNSYNIAMNSNWNHTFGFKILFRY